MTAVQRINILKTTTTAAVSSSSAAVAAAAAAAAAASSSTTTMTTSNNFGGGGGNQQQHQQQQQHHQQPQLQTRVSKSLLDEASLVLSTQFLGNVAAQYTPPAPSAFVPVTIEKVVKPKRRRKKTMRKLQEGTDQQHQQQQQQEEYAPQASSAPEAGGGAVACGEDESRTAENSPVVTPRAGEDVDEKEQHIPDAASESRQQEHQQTEGQQAETQEVESQQEQPKIIRIPPPIPAVSTYSLPALDVAAPARNLCVELLSTRVVACVKTLTLMLQEFSSSPGQSLPHVGIIGAGNVGSTILTHLVKLLPPDRIVLLTRDEKSETCMHYSSHFGIRCLSTNILRDNKLVDVVKNHRLAQEREREEKTRTGLAILQLQSSGGAAAAAAASSAAMAGGGGAGGGAGAGGGGGSTAAASHVSPEVAAAHNISVALEQLHVLIVACRPSQLTEVASSLQPWLRASSVTILSTLAGVTADRVAQLFRVPASVSVTVDSNEMLFAFESASRMNARAAQPAAAALLGRAGAGAASAAGGGGDDINSPGGGGGGADEVSAAASALSTRVASMAFGPSISRLAAEGGDMMTLSLHGGAGGGGLMGFPQQRQQLRFFTREPLDFVHRLFFALVTTLLERCGVQPAHAWVGVARLLLGRAVEAPPGGVACQGPQLVAKCGVQHLAAAANLSVGEVMQIVDVRMARFIGIETGSSV